jgi:hypothetical protein
LIVCLWCHFDQQIWPPVRHHPPSQMVRLSSSGRRNVISAPPLPRCLELPYDFKYT